MELDLIAWLRKHLPPHPLLKLGIGDDAAVLALGKDRDALVTVDILTDQVDFKLGECDPRQIGRKALAVNLSDIAAMAGEPVAAVVGLVLPRQGGLELAKQIYEGLLPLAGKFQTAIAGGDTNSWDGPLVVSITLIGRTTSHGPLTRSGARVGDKILVTGSFGGSILGRHFTFTPRVREALKLCDRYQVHAAIDCSDGLSLDLARLAEASRCSATVDVDHVPISPDAQELSRRDGTPALEHALGNGEDFELIMAVPPRDADEMLADQPLNVPLTCIGEFGTGSGLWQRSARGLRQPLEQRGYVHRL
ncbi:MAG: thiamine-monophosphate kinase [Planctomycetaceae bacterium]|nr:thiamine-monophosphate kinase [Planctomycetaceae bacterium]